jgi:3-oxoacyl-[acyl-carrier protein] reductase
VRNIVVTGGTRGIGLEIVRKVVASGDRAIVVARNSTLESETLSAAGPENYAFHPFDLAETEKIEDLVKQIRKEHGPISALVNNAAMGLEGLLTTLKPAQIERATKLNLLAPILMARAVAKSMLTGSGGRIINISSVNAFTGYNGLAAYAATKAGLIGFTKSFAREVGGANILVNAVAPGLVETQMVGKMQEETRSKIKRRSPLDRFTTADEVANAVLFLLSNASSGITGTVLTVDAGNSA